MNKLNITFLEKSLLSQDRDKLLGYQWSRATNCDNLLPAVLWSASLNLFFAFVGLKGFQKPSRRCVHRDNCFLLLLRQEFSLLLSLFFFLRVRVKRRLLPETMTVWVRTVGKWGEQESNKLLEFWAARNLLSSLLKRPVSRLQIFLAIADIFVLKILLPSITSCVN